MAGPDAPLLDAADGKGIDPEVMMRTLQSLLTGIPYDELPWGEMLAMTPGREDGPCIERLTVELRDALADAEVGRLPGKERDPSFRTKPQLAVELVQAAQQAGIGFQAVVTDCFYGDNPSFTQALTAANVPFVLALKPRKGTWAPADQVHTPVEAAGELGWRGPSRPGQWRRIQRRFRDGHAEAWWAADARLGGWGPDRRLRLVVATTDPGKLPGHSTWYLLTDLPRPTGRRAQPADLAEVVRLYGLRNWGLFTVEGVVAGWMVAGASVPG